MPLSNVIAKEKLSAYQRWEMTSLDDHSQPQPFQPGSPTNKGELEQLKLKAQKEGFAKGFDEGHQTGLQTGRQEGLQSVQRELAILQQVFNHLNAYLKEAEHSLAQGVLDLALDLAKAMLKSAFKVNPELIIPVVEQAIASLPSAQLAAKLFLHPTDASLVSNKIGADLSKAGWSILPDSELKPGDCRIETLTNQINASLSSRWNELANALGRHSHWYEITEHDINNNS